MVKSKCIWITRQNPPSVYEGFASLWRFTEDLHGDVMLSVFVSEVWHAHVELTDFGLEVRSVLEHQRIEKIGFGFRQCFLSTHHELIEL